MKHLHFFILKKIDHVAGRMSKLETEHWLPESKRCLVRHAGFGLCRRITMEFSDVCKNGLTNSNEHFQCEP